MSNKIYRVHFTERWNIGGQKFTHTGDHNAPTIIECLESIAKQSITMSNYDDSWDSIWAKHQRCGEYISKLDYRGVPGHLKIDQHNPAVMTLRGFWAGVAQSDDHIAPYMEMDACFSAPNNEAITDLDAYQILTWLYVRNYSVVYDPSNLPGKRYWWRESNKTNKRNAEGMKFPPTFKVNR